VDDRVCGGDGAGVTAMSGADPARAARRFRTARLLGATRATLAGWALLAAASPAPAADSAYVSSAELGTIVKVDLATGRVTPFAEAGRPEGGACSPSGVVVFADAYAERLFRYAPDGLPTEVVPTFGASVGPEGPSFDRAGNLYFVTHPQRSWLPDGAFRVPGADPARPPEQIAGHFSAWAEGTSVVRGGPHAGEVLLIGAIESKVWLADPVHRTLRLLVDASAFPAIAGLYGVATSRTGDVYVSSTTGVYRFDPEGGFVGVVAEAPAGSSFGFMDVGTRDELYVVDTGAGILWRIDPGPGRVLFPVAAVKAPLGVAVCREGDRVTRPGTGPGPVAADGARAR